MKVNGRPLMADAAIGLVGGGKSKSGTRSTSGGQPTQRGGYVMDEDSSRMEGLLSKRGLNGMWHERYFVFDGQTLVYYKRRPGSSSKSISRSSSRRGSKMSASSNAGTSINLWNVEDVELDGDRIVLRFGSTSTRASVTPNDTSPDQSTATDMGSRRGSRTPANKKPSTRRRLQALSKAVLFPSIFGMRSTIELKANNEYEASMWLQAMYNRPLEGTSPADTNAPGWQRLGVHGVKLINPSVTLANRRGSSGRSSRNGVIAKAESLESLNSGGDSTKLMLVHDLKAVPVGATLVVDLSRPAGLGGRFPKVVGSVVGELPIHELAHKSTAVLVLEHTQEQQLEQLNDRPNKKALPPVRVEVKLTAMHHRSGILALLLPDDATVGGAVIVSVIYVLLAVIIGPVIACVAVGGLALLVVSTLAIENKISNNPFEGLLHRLLSVTCTRIGFGMVDAIAVRQVWISDVSVAPPNKQLLPAPSVSIALDNSCVVREGVASLRNSVRKRRPFSARVSRRGSTEISELIAEAAEEDSKSVVKATTKVSKRVHDVSISPGEYELLAVLRLQLKDLSGTNPIISKYTDTDYRLVRFIRGNNGDLKKAEKQFRKAMEWRVNYEVNPDKITQEWTPPEWLLTYAGSPVFNRLIEEREGRREFFQRDKKGCLALWYRGGRLNWRQAFKKMDNDGELLFRCGIWVIETVMEDLDRLHEETSGKSTSSLTIVMDLEGFAMREQIPLTKAVPLARKYLGLITTVYPELLQSVIVINAPWLFHSIWSAFTPFLPDRVVDKIKIHGSRDIPKKVRKILTDDNIPTWMEGGMLAIENLDDHIAPRGPFMPDKGKSLLTI